MENDAEGGRAGPPHETHVRLWHLDWKWAAVLLHTLNAIKFGRRTGGRMLPTKSSA